MILLRYGTTIQSVEPNFDSKAFTEIGFRRDRGYSSLASDFLDGDNRFHFYSSVSSPLKVGVFKAS